MNPTSRISPVLEPAQVLDAIAVLEPALLRAGDQELRDRAAALRPRDLAGVPLETLLPECFALVREIARRVLGERPYDVQMLAGLLLHRGKLVEMQTGEGKTLAAVAPVALHALAGRGVHVLTYNDYLARRDAAWMRPVHRWMGLTVGCVQEGLGPEERQRAYRADVTYLTVKEAGFDLLRDGLGLDTGGQVHRPFHCALVDEADSLLIDEARIPLVIAGHLDPPGLDLQRLSALARSFERGSEFDTDEYGRNVFLTDRGLRRAEASLGCGGLHAADNVRLHAELRNALHAEALLRRDIDYIVRDGRIELVDELTGRVAENRHWPDGLQAALEAKEGLLPQPEGRVLGSITIQHFLRKYPRLCGMTATAQPAADELARVYGLDVAPVPPHRPCIRIDHPDVIHASKEAKRRALAGEIARVHATGRPILSARSVSRSRSGSPPTCARRGSTAGCSTRGTTPSDLRQRLLSSWELLERQRGELQDWRQAVLEGRDEASLLAGRSRERWSRLRDLHGEGLLRAIERRITLVAIDRCWSDHVTEMQALRDEVHLVQLGGVDPFVHFYRTAGAGFEATLDRIDETIVEVFERVAITEDGVDWESEGLRGPSSTWTYLVNDNVLGSNTFLTLANRPAIGLWAVLVCWWVLLPWALALHWRRWRQRREPVDEEE